MHWLTQSSHGQLLALSCSHFFLKERCNCTKKCWLSIIMFNVESSCFAKILSNIEKHINPGDNSYQIDKKVLGHTQKRNLFIPAFFKQKQMCNNRSFSLWYAMNQYYHAYPYVLWIDCFDLGTQSQIIAK